MGAGLFEVDIHDVDIVKTTVSLAVYSQTSSELITNKMLAAMKQGSVIINLAGGNHEGTRLGEITVQFWPTIIGESFLSFNGS